MEHLNKLISKDLVIGLPKHKFEKDRLCDVCQKGKQGFLSNHRILYLHFNPYNFYIWISLVPLEL